MVPSIAIREGIKKSLEITQEHFQEQYKKKIRFFVYDNSNSSNIANIRAFSDDSNLQVMIINHQAFNSTTSQRSQAARRIYAELDEIGSLRPIDVIKSTRPILILDEPQKIGEKTEKTLEEFNPLFKLRYSATHKKDKEYNKIYKLDAVDAYNQKLVKKIYVKGVELINDRSIDTYMYLDTIDISEKRDPIAKLEILEKSSTGTRKVLRRVKPGVNLFELSKGLAEYKGYVVSEINCMGDNNKVMFTNGKEISVGQAVGEIDGKHIARLQIRETIKSHFKKERQLYKMGVKVLSLFFIDKVANYKFYEEGNPLKGEYADIFEEEYNKIFEEEVNFIDEEYQKYLNSFETERIHAGYFSIDKKGQEIDSSGNNETEDVNTYDLIMKDKERLLSLEEPVRFIFSHSALREGWDNPNVFQICTLKRSSSEMSKRQELGRGLRIAVNNNGERMDSSVLEGMFHDVNALTVIASESYEKFAAALQKEMAETIKVRATKFSREIFVDKELRNEKGEKFIISENAYMNLAFHHVSKNYVDSKEDYKITDTFLDAIETGNIELPEEIIPFKESYLNLTRKIYSKVDNYVENANVIDITSLQVNENFMKKEFQELWNKINVKTVYEVNFNSEELIEKAIEALNGKLKVSRIRARVSYGEQKDRISAESLKDGSSLTKESESTYQVEDFVVTSTKYDLIGEIADETELTRKTIIKILQGIKKVIFDQFKYNPEEFIRKASRLINEEKATMVINGITYHKTEERFHNEIFTINNINASLGKNAIDVKKHIYDYLVTDSKIEKEFAEGLETGEVIVYSKLPSGFKIPTPLGNYNPDWAIVLDNKEFKHVYFIAETKGSLSSLDYRDVEKAKIACAREHFKSLNEKNVVYDVVNGYEELINVVTQIK